MCSSDLKEIHPQKLESIARLISPLIENSPLVPAWEMKFRDDALQRTVHFGTKIEGNDLTAEQARQVVMLDDSNLRSISEKAGIMARDRDIQEVINYRNVVWWIDQQQNIANPNILSEKTFKKLHSLTTARLIDEQYVGVYRDKEGYFFGALGIQNPGYPFEDIPTAAKVIP